MDHAMEEVVLVLMLMLLVAILALLLADAQVQLMLNVVLQKVDLHGILTKVNTGQLFAHMVEKQKV
jgi:accessory gene regulator protein AgrB